MNIRIGQKFRNLEIRSLLGEGSMGVVYLASHPILQSSFVIKIGKGTPIEDPFVEARLGSRMNSPFVVDVVDAGIENNTPFIIHRYVDGVDFKELLSFAQKTKHDGLSIGVVSQLMSDIAQGLHSIHQAGVIHRDIKPANLFLQGDGTSLLGDFGIATVQKQSSIIGGTPQYMAPEVWKKGLSTVQSDLYALGATAHELATGTPVYQTTGVENLAHAHCTQRYTPPQTSQSKSHEFFSLLSHMLRKDPNDRPRNASFVAQRFQQLAAPKPEIRTLKRTGQDWDFGELGSLRVAIGRRDLSQCDSYADILVNAANTDLHMRQGVASAISKAAGSTVAIEAAQYAPVTMGDVVWTSAGSLQSTAIAHAVAAHSGAICIQRATLRSLLQAEEREGRIIAFPALGAGVGQVPMAVSCQLMLSSFRTFAWLQPQKIQEIALCLYNQSSFRQARKSILGL